MLSSARKLYLIFLLLLSFSFAGFCQLPSPKWVNDIGGQGDSKPTGMITDAQNNIYISGLFSGTVDFDPSPAFKNLTSVGGYDAYVAKYTSAGALIWAVSIGGSGLEQVNNMTVDANGNPTIIGQFDSSALTAGSTTLQNSGAEDIFMVHLNTNGNILWAKSFGGGTTDRGEEITADGQGNLISTSIFQSSFTVGGSNISSPGGQYNGLIIKQDAAGNLLWDIDLGGNGDTEVYGVGIDSNGNIVVSGSYSGSVDFDPLGTHNTLNNGSGTGFVAKYTPAGKLIWVNVINGNFVNNQSVVAIGQNDAIYITGAFSSPVTFTGAASLIPQGQDTFIAKYTSGGSLMFAKDLGGNGASSYPYQIRSDASDNVYVSGYFSGTIDFNPDPAATANVSFHGQRDFFLAKLDKTGAYQWAFGGGNPNCNQTFGVELAIDNNNNVILGGAFCSTVNFDPTSCTTANVTAQNFNSDTFIASYVQNTTPNAIITAFSIPQQIAAATINQVNHTIAVTVAPGTDVTTLVPSISVSNGGTISPTSGIAQNFTSPVVYAITSGCGGASYTVTITLALAKNNTTCPGSPNTVTGDAASPVPDSYAWQLLQNNVWANAPGVNNAKDYQTSALTNNTNSSVVYQLRRQISVGGVISYDSFYNITVQQAIAITNNQITQPSVAAFCLNGDPGSIAGSAPSGGTGTYTFQWQSSTDNVSFNNIAGATSGDYDPPALTATTYYQRIATSGNCAAPVVSNVVTITILPAVANNTITAPAITSFCQSGNPSAITGSVPSGGTGTYVYQWQSSSDNTTFTDIAGATSKDFTPASITATTYYRRTVTSGACITPLISNTVTITILPVVANNSITAPAVTIFCTNGDPANIAGTTPSGGNGTYTYQWQNSTDNVNFSDISGANAIDFDPPVISVNTWYRRVVTTAICATPLLSNVVAINVASKPANPVPANPVIQVCSGSTASLSVSSPQQGITYDWYDSASKTNHLFTGIPFVTNPLNANQTFYVEASNGTCSSINLASVQVNILNLPVPPQLVSNPVPVCNGSVATFNISSPQNGYAYNWYTTPTGGSPIFTGIGFATPALTTNTTYYAEAVNGNGCISLSRTPANVTVNALPQVTVQGAAVCPGSAATLTATSTDQNAVINWYASATGGNILTTSNTFLIPVLNAPVTYYTEAADNTTGCLSAARTPVQAQILQQLAAPVVTAGPTTSSSIIFQWTAVTGATGYRVSIDNGQTFADPSSGSAGLTTTLTGLLPLQSVTILVQATGSQPCQLSGSSTAVTAKAIDTHNNLIYVPNAFTPNGDGKNDVVYVHSESIKSLKFYVYNQWGELLYTSLSQQSGWDGNYKGVREPAGVYVYYLEATMNDGQQINKKGTITLLR